VKITQLSLENTQKYNLRSKLLDPKDLVTRFDDLYTDEFGKEPRTPAPAPSRCSAPKPMLRTVALSEHVHLGTPCSTVLGLVGEPALGRSPRRGAKSALRCGRLRL
jgi:hypothetical protein